MKKVFYILTIVTVVLVISSCHKFSPFDQVEGGKGQGNEGLQMLVVWNNAGIEAWTRFSSSTGPAPMAESRIYAIINIAMYDVLNSIKPTYKAYAFLSREESDASIDAAIATAAHDAIASLIPSQAAYADSLLQVSLSGINNGISKQKGIEAGEAAAAAILTKRTADGSEDAQFAYTPGTLPGEYRATPPFDGPPFNGFVQEPGWGNVKPFGLASSSQFRPVPPYPINSADYTNDYNEVKSLGGSTSTTRTPDQTQIALFWAESAPSGWNRIARNLITMGNMDVWKSARLFALVAMAEADANIGSFDGKFFYNYWRPITAIRLGDSDGNPNTTGDTSWDVLLPPTPPVPDYPSNHAVNGGAASEVLRDFFGDDNISFDATSLSLPGVTRHFTSFSQAARENSLSRIYIGFHFRNAVAKGEDEGNKIGKYIFDHYLKAL